jgi:hypothetical protein
LALKLPPSVSRVAFRRGGRQDSTVALNAGQPAEGVTGIPSLVAGSVNYESLNFKAGRARSPGGEFRWWIPAPGARTASRSSTLGKPSLLFVIKRKGPKGRSSVVS